MQETRTSYRIMYNTLNYRVQWLGKTVFLRRSKWYWLRQDHIEGDSTIANFDTEEAARNTITQCCDRDRAMEQGYSVVKTINPVKT